MMFENSIAVVAGNGDPAPIVPLPLRPTNALMEIQDRMIMRRNKGLWTKLCVKLKVTGMVTEHALTVSQCYYTVRNCMAAVLPAMLLGILNYRIAVGYDCVQIVSLRSPVILSLFLRSN